MIESPLHNLQSAQLIADLRGSLFTLFIAISITKQNCLSNWLWHDCILTLFFLTLFLQPTSIFQQYIGKQKLLLFLCLIVKIKLQSYSGGLFLKVSEVLHIYFALKMSN